MGTLVRILINVDLLDDTSILKGEFGIIIDNNIDSEEHFFTNFDYLILLGGCELLVFEDEIEIYI